MIRTALRYHRPATLREASEILLAHGNGAAVIAGGTQLLPKMNRHEIAIEHVVDIAGLGLDRIAIDDRRVEIGAMATYADVLACDALHKAGPLLPRMALGVTGGRQILMQGTLVGSVCLNFATSEAPAVFLAVDATVSIHGSHGPREVAIADFQTGACEVALRPGEFVTALSFPRHARAGYCKLKHAAGSWPIVTAAIVGDTEHGGPTVTIGAAQALPVRIPLDGERLAAQVAAALTMPIADELADRAYRLAIAPVAARRAFAQFLEMGQ